MNQSERDRLADLIKKARGNQSERQWAIQNGLKPLNVNYWARAKTSPNEENLRKLARAFGLTYWELLEKIKREDPPEREEIQIEDILWALRRLRFSELFRVLEEVSRLIRWNLELKENEKTATPDQKSQELLNESFSSVD